MLNFVICDDDINIATTVKKIITETEKDIACSVFSSPESLIREYKEKKIEADAFILDIEMNGMSGIELAKEIRQKDQMIAEQNEQDAYYELYEKAYEGAKNSRWKNLVENSQGLFKGNFTDSIKNLAGEWVSDSKTMQQKKESLESTRQTVDRETSDRLLKIVIKEFKKNIM